MDSVDRERVAQLAGVIVVMSRSPRWLEGRNRSRSRSAGWYAAIGGRSRVPEPVVFRGLRQQGRRRLRIAEMQQGLKEVTGLSMNESECVIIETTAVCNMLGGPGSLGFLGQRLPPSSAVDGGPPGPGTLSRVFLILADSRHCFCHGATRSPLIHRLPRSRVCCTVSNNKPGARMGLSKS